MKHDKTTHRKEPTLSGIDDMRALVPEISKQLLPCPFCGGGVYLKMVEYRRHGATPRFFINHRKWAPKSCPYHRTSNHLSFVDPRQALKEWNQRA